MTVTPASTPGAEPIPLALTVTDQSAPAGTPAGREAVLARRIRLLVAGTITYNLVEAVVALVAGSRASSGALIGFGLDSVIEVSSAAAVGWQFSARSSQQRQERERAALRIIAVSFLTLAAYVGLQALHDLARGAQAEHSTVGLALAALSLLVMPLLSTAQRRAGRELGSLSAVADSKQTMLCTYLSAVLLVGLGVNSLFGWTWADPTAALIIAVIAVREGRQAWRGDGCCAPTLTSRTTPPRTALPTAGFDGCCGAAATTPAAADTAVGDDAADPGCCCPCATAPETDGPAQLAAGTRTTVPLESGR